jgi:hypothetical protein
MKISVISHSHRGIPDAPILPEILQEAMNFNPDFIG